MASRKSIRSEKQWRWVADRYLEGYFIKDLAEFLGMNRRNVERRLRSMGVVPYIRRDLPPLEDRKKEFMELE